ncbi:MAG: flavin reductase family protein [bacterium]
MPVDPNEFKAALSRWGSGVCVVTASDGEGRLGGLTASSFTSVSLTPPLVLFCLGQDSTSYGVFERADGFVVHILAAGQEHLSNLFSSKSTDKFEQVDYRAGAGGAPILSGCLAVLECSARQKITAGDHLILVGEVQSAQSEEAAPLWYYRGGYRKLTE